MSKIVINWELSLLCNLDCSFCSQGFRRKKQKYQLSFEQITQIIRHLPEGVHISFLGGETLLHSRIGDIFHLLEERDITYEITTNGTLLHKLPIGESRFRGLSHINISIDGYGSYHDISRGKTGLFDTLQEQIPRILPFYSVSISTVLIESLSDENFIRLLLYLDSLGIEFFKLIYCMSFGEVQIQESQKYIPELQVDVPGEGTQESLSYKAFFLKKLFLARKILKHTKLHIEPVGLFLSQGTPSCKQIATQYRINEYGRLSICEFITNEYTSLIDSTFEEAVHQLEYLSIKNQIQTHFPLSICKNCCKLEK